MAARAYDGMTYRQLQRWNKDHLTSELNRERQQNGLKNRGWEFVIQLYHWLQRRSTGGSAALQKLLHKASGLKQIESQIKTAVRSTRDRAPQRRSVPQNRIAEFIR